ncbi:MAG TPA: hypothetical protein VIS06_22960 [Mycobacteriales bacterium]|jgi:hypothetical protein
MTGPDAGAAGERRLAAGLFNRVWELLDRTERTPAEDDEMVNAAHASRYFWGRVGTPVNVARGEWQCARVYAALGRAEPALHHARRCLDVCDRHDLGDFDLACAHEALARASRVAGREADTRRHVALGLEAAGRITDPDDARIVLTDLTELTELSG